MLKRTDHDASCPVRVGGKGSQCSCSAFVYAVLAEFVTDVEMAGVDEVEREWPDLIVTYRKAKALL
jgi:hypothetical protein